MESFLGRLSAQMVFVSMQDNVSDKGVRACRIARGKIAIRLDALSGMATIPSTISAPSDRIAPLTVFVSRSPGDCLQTLFLHWYTLLWHTLCFLSIANPCKTRYLDKLNFVHLSFSICFDPS